MKEIDTLLLRSAVPSCANSNGSSSGSGSNGGARPRTSNRSLVRNPYRHLRRNFAIFPGQLDHLRDLFLIQCRDGATSQEACEAIVEGQRGLSLEDGAVGGREGEEEEEQGEREDPRCGRYTEMRARTEIYIF